MNIRRQFFKKTALLFLLLFFNQSWAQTALNFVEVVKDNINGVTGLSGVSDIAVSADGKFVYSAAHASSSVACFSRDVFTGLLTFRSVASQGANGVTGISQTFSIAASSDNKSIYVASPTSSSVTSFSRDITTGALTFVNTLATGNGMTVGGFVSVSVSPDGKWVYGIGASGIKGIAVFSRDIQTGAITFVEQHINGVNGNLLDQDFNATSSPIKNIATSADGKFLYVTATASNTVSVYSINQTTGHLTLITVYKDGVGGVDGLQGASSLLLSPDGKHLYVSGQKENSIAVFSVDQTTGTLTYLNKLTNGVDGIISLAGVRSLAINPDGKYLYASAITSNAITAFSRDASNGKLTLNSVLKNGSNHVEGVNVPSGMMMDPLSKNLYVAAQNPGSIVVFESSVPAVVLSSNEVTTSNNVAVILDPAIVIKDADSGNLRSATVKITNGMSADLLSVAVQSGVSATYVASTKTLSLVGTASLSKYIDILRSLSYTPSLDPSVTPGTTSYRVISISVVDEENNSSADAVISVKINPPTTASIVVSDTTLSIGQTTTVTITFSEAVTGFTNADLTVANGTLSAVSSSDGGVTWTATFTPNANVTAPTNVITLDNTGVTDGAGNTGIGNTTSNNFVIDTQRPTASIVVSDTTLSIGQTTTVTITFSEAVTGFTSGDLSFSNGTLSAVSSSDGGITWIAIFTPTSGITAPTNVITLNYSGVTDLAGNAGIGTTTSTNFVIDTQRPTASIVVSDTTLNIGETTTVTITFSEAVTGFSRGDLSVSNGTLSAVSSSDGGVTWTATFTPNANVTAPTNVIILDNTGVTDSVGNTGSGTKDSNNYKIDTQPPTASIVVSDTMLSIGQITTVTITFSEAVTGFTNADLTVANGTLSAVSSSDGGVTWTATFTPNANVTAPTNVITLDNTGVTDSVGNTGSGTKDSNNYKIDTQRPTASIVVSDTTLSIGQTTTVTITFSEAVTGFTNTDLTVANGTLSAVSSSDGGVRWTATFTPNANVTAPTNVITLDNTGVTDSVDNTGIGNTTSNNFVIDTQQPNVSSVGLPTNGTYKNGEQLNFTLNFNEIVNVTSIPSIALTIGTKLVQAFYQSGSGTSSLIFSYTVQKNDLDTDGISLGNLQFNGGIINDIAGNSAISTLNGVGSTNAVLVDGRSIPEVISIVKNGVSPTNLNSITYTITFSEDVKGVDSSDFTITKIGSVSGIIVNNINGSGAIYTVTVDNISGEGTLRLDLNSNGTGILSLFGKPIENGFTAGDVYVIDRVAPNSPTNFKAVTKDKSVDLSWNANTEPDLKEYELYEDKNGTKILLATIAKGTLTYLHSNINNGTTYNYSLHAVDNLGNKSIEATISAIPMGNQVIAFNLRPEIIYGEDIALDALSDAGLEVSFQSLDSSIAEVYQDTSNKWRLKAKKVGQVNIEAFQNGNSTYLPALSVTNKIEVKPASLTVTADAKSKVYGDVDPVLTYDVSGLVNGDTKSVVSGSLVRVVGEAVGDYPINQGSLVTSNNYTLAYAPANLAITKAPITGITFTNQISVYDGKVKSLSIAGTLPTGASVTYSDNDKTEAGRYTVTATINGGNNYESQTLTAQLEITKAPIVGITFNNNSFVFDGNVKSLSIAGTLPIGASVTYSDNDKIEAGKYTVTATINGGNNYKSQTLTANLEITKAPIVGITFNNNSFVYDGKVKSLSIAGTLPTGATVSYFGNNQTEAGTYEVTVILNGGNFNNQSLKAILTIEKANQTINWNQDLVIGCASEKVIQLTARSSSGLPIVYHSSNESIAQVNGNEIILVGNGYVEITATQEGNNNYLSASNITISLNNRLTGMVKQKWNDVLVFDNSSSDFVKWQWYKNGKIINGATGQFYQSSEPLSGTYYVIVTDKKGNEIETCPLVIVANQNKGGIKVVSNPARQGQMFKVIADYTNEELINAKLVITDVTGKVVKEVNKVEPTTTLQAPLTASVYVVHLFLEDGRKTSVKMLVD